MLRKNNMLIGFTVVMFVGCSSQKHIVNDPVNLPLPTKNKTNLSESLSCFSDLLVGYRYMVTGQNVKPLFLSIQSVKDMTGISNEYNKEIPNDMTDMAVGIASNIGGALRIAHIPTTQERLDAHYAKQIGSEPKFSFKQYIASNLIYGALTEYDRSLGNNKNTFNIGSEFGGGYGDTKLNATFNNVKNISRISMDFRVIDNNSGVVYNSLSSSNTIWLHQSGDDQSYGLSINGQAIGYLNSDTEVDARHVALRLLIERGLIDSIGKLERIPYWRCLPQEISKSSTQKSIQPENLVKFDDILISHYQKKNQSDLRDEDVIYDIKMDFENGDYEDNNGLLRYAPREIADREVENAQPILGKVTKIQRVLSWYEKHDQQVMTLPDIPSKLEYLREKFKYAGILPQQETDLYGLNMYMALWLNAPYRKNARWEQ